MKLMCGGGRAVGDQVGGDGAERGGHLESVAGEADGHDHPVHAGHEAEQAGLVDVYPSAHTTARTGRGTSAGRNVPTQDCTVSRCRGSQVTGRAIEGDLVQVDAGRDLHGPAVRAGEAVELGLPRAADENLLATWRASSSWSAIGNQVSTCGSTARWVPSAAHTGPAPVPVATSTRGARTSSLIGADQPAGRRARSRARTCRLPRNGRRGAGPGTAAQNTARSLRTKPPSGSNNGHVTVADQVLGQTLAGLGPADDLKAEALAHGRRGAGRRGGVVMIHDRHHARDGQQLAPLAASSSRHRSRARCSSGV